MSDTELLIVTTFEEFYIYNILIGEPRAVDAEEFNARLDQLKHSSDGTQNPDVSVMTVYPGGLEYYINDVSFPLPEYPVNYESGAYYKNYHYPDPARWFHTDKTLEGCSNSNCARYAGAGECMGFARYVHDVYNHMLDYTITDSNPDQWYVGKNMHHAVKDANDNWIFPYYFENNEEKVRQFFANLQTGNYVRYGRYDDDSIANGMHSMVLVGKDSGGIWVYECNQNYYKDLASDRINGRPKSFFGCGVHLQYHTYDVLAVRYNFVVKYTNHAYTESPIYDNATYHKVGCTFCAGYLRQEHDDVTVYDYVDEYDHSARLHCCGDILRDVPHTNVSRTTVNAANHRAVYLCCNYGETTSHFGKPSYFYYSTTQHRVQFTCCSGSALENHYYYDSNGVPADECLECGYNRVSGAK